MSNRREWQPVLLVLVLLGIAAVATIASCGGGGGGGSSSNGGLCEQCGDTDGPCNIAGANVSPDQDQPQFCPNRAAASGTTCHVALVCSRKVDSGQRRCFPADPNIETHPLDLRYECDGSRPAGTPPPIATATPTPTALVTSTAPTPTSTETPLEPTATGVTPSPEVTATPIEPAKDVDVTITVATSDDSDLPSTFSATVTYQTSKGSFLPLDCNDDDGLTTTDNGTGTLSLSFSSSDTGGLSDAATTCTFHQAAGQTLANADLHASVNPSTLTITIDDL